MEGLLSKAREEEGEGMVGSSAKTGCTWKLLAAQNPEPQTPLTNVVSLS